MCCEHIFFSEYSIDFQIYTNNRFCSFFEAQRGAVTMGCGCFYELCVCCILDRLEHKDKAELSEVDRLDMELYLGGVFSKMLFQKKRLTEDELVLQLSSLSVKQCARFAMFALEHPTISVPVAVLLTILKHPNCNIYTFCGFATEEWISERHSWFAAWPLRTIVERRCCDIQFRKSRVL